jgi:hypothetical protein
MKSNQRQADNRRNLEAASASAKAVRQGQVKELEEAVLDLRRAELELKEKVAADREDLKKRQREASEKLKDMRTAGKKKRRGSLAGE